MRIWATRHAQVLQRDFIHREDSASGPIFRRHVGDRGAIGERQRTQARAKELHELSYNAGLAQNLGHRKHPVGGRRAFGQISCELESHHLRQKHRNRLPEHCRLGLNSANAPTQHTQAIDHGRVRVRSY